MRYEVYPDGTIFDLILNRRIKYQSEFEARRIVEQLDESDWIASKEFQRLNSYKTG